MIRYPPTRPATIIRPMSPLAIPTCFSGTRSGTSPANGPRATFEVNCRHRKKRSKGRNDGAAARPTSEAAARIDPTRMNGRRRPQRDAK
jgi:hypothetical protein